MSDSSLKALVKSYSEALETLENQSSALPPEKILKVLLIRDQIQAALANRKDPSGNALLKIFELDDRLNKQAEKIHEAVELEAWRTSQEIDESAWWWVLKIQTEAPSFSWWDAFLDIVALFCWIVIGSLILDIMPRFLSGGPDRWAAFAVVVQAVLTALAAGGALSQAGQEMLKQIPSKLIPTTSWPQRQLVIAIPLLMVFLLLRFSLPRIATFYHNRGAERHHAGHLISAQFDYERALKLNPDYIEPHYNLGSLYEDLQKFDMAQEEYLVAVQGKLLPANNNLARLYILNEEYAAAVPLLLTALRDDQDQNDKVRYGLLKNLGWARFGQARYAEAESHLEQAIEIDDEKGAAHCLLAQVFDEQAKTELALEEWNACVSYADGRNPDEDAWIGMAHKRLEGEN